MATLSRRIIHDQNVNVLCDGTTGGKSEIRKADKKGGLGGRKALNDISNSNKPPKLQATKKDNSVLSIGKDLSILNAASSVRGKSNLVNSQEKGKVGGRKPLGDLTNSVKPSAQQVSKKSQKLNAIAEDIGPDYIAEESFLHNHKACIKAQKETVDLESFLKLVGLGTDPPVKLFSTLRPSQKKRESPVKHLEMEELLELPFEAGVSQHQISGGISGNCSPACQSPKSPKAPFNWQDDRFSDSVLSEILVLKP